MEIELSQALDLNCPKQIVGTVIGLLKSLMNYKIVQTFLIFEKVTLRRQFVIFRNGFWFENYFSV